MDVIEYRVSARSPIGPFNPTEFPHPELENSPASKTQPVPTDLLRKNVDSIRCIGIPIR